MFFTKWQEMALLAACVCILAMPGMATTVTVGPATIPAAGASVDVTVVADSFPYGLSGYIMNASVADPSVAEITGVAFPAWASFKLNSPVPAGEVSLRASDLSLGVSAGAANVTLVTLTIRGKAAGTTVLDLRVRQMDPDGARDPIIPTVVPGTISVGVSSRQPHRPRHRQPHRPRHRQPHQPRHRSRRNPRTSRSSPTPRGLGCPRWDNDRENTPPGIPCRTRDTYSHGHLPGIQGIYNDCDSQPG